MKITFFLAILYVILPLVSSFYYSSGSKKRRNSYSKDKRRKHNKYHQQTLKPRRKVETNLPKFVQKYGKSYGSYNQLLYRDTVFKKNINMIEQNNNKQSAEFQMGVTRFTDLTSDEFNSLILMPKVQQQQIKKQIKNETKTKIVNITKKPSKSQTYFNQSLGKQLKSKKQSSSTSSSSSYKSSKKIRSTQNSSSNVTSLTTQLNLKSSVLPLSAIAISSKTQTATIINWVLKGKVGIIKQQGICGSCYAFSALSALQSMYLINNMTTMGKSAFQLGKTKNRTFSQQHIVDCCDIPKRCDMGCAGGYVWSVFEFINKKGVYLEQNYPYRAFDETYIRKCDGAKGLFHNLLNTTFPYFNVSKGNTTQLREVLAKGPVSVLIDATNMPFYVSDGSSNPKPFNNCTDKIHNHAVLLVGVDKQGNWLIKNSWGSQWGNNGYITLAPGNTCGIANYATYPNPYFISNEKK